MDIEKYIDHWKNGALEDLEVAQVFINRDKRAVYGLFFIHLSLEKLLKAHVCKQTKELPPRIHDLLRLAELGKIE